ncbi:MAG: phosphoribosylanthranilate isomerase [Rhodospirillales bacterium]|nr:phosphoribosylanthranilate isomerase [Rhodospirillales bacterium]
MQVDVKICGLGTAETVAAAVDGGAAYLGFVFFPPSPRRVTPDEAGELAAAVPEGIAKVGLVVDADDQALRTILSRTPLDFLQLHGDEHPRRVREIKDRFGLGVIKAIAVSGPEDIEKARTYEDVADLLLFDAKPPEGAERPGGNALVFDWRLISGASWQLPWLLAGGIDTGNLAAAVDISGAAAVDVSSGVEDQPGVKNAEKIGAFLRAAKSL